MCSDVKLTNLTLWDRGNGHPEGLGAGYDLDSEQHQRWKDNVPCPIRDGS